MGPSGRFTHVIVILDGLGQVLCRFCIWVELPEQRRLCRIFVKNVGSPDIHGYSIGGRVVNGPPGFGASQQHLTQAKTYRDKGSLSRHKAKNKLCCDTESLYRDPNSPTCLGTMSRHGEPGRDTGPEKSVAPAPRSSAYPGHVATCQRAPCSLSCVALSHLCTLRHARKAAWLLTLGRVAHARNLVVGVGTVVCAALSLLETLCRNREPEFSIATRTHKWAVAHPFSSSALPTLFHAFPPIPLPLNNFHKQYNSGNFVNNTHKKFKTKFLLQNLFFT